MSVSVDNPIKQKRIAYISDHQFPLNRSDADAEQAVNTVSSLAEEGLEVKLIIPKRWKNIGVPISIRKKNIQDYYRVGNSFEMAELLHLPLMPLRLEKYSHALLATPYAKITNCDILYARNRAHAIVALNMGMPVVFETYRIYSHSLFGFAKPLARLTHRRNLLGVIHHSIPSRENLIEAGADQNKTIVIHNGFNPKQLQPKLTQAQARAVLGWDKMAKIISYTGRLDKMKGIDFLLDLAEMTPEINFHLVGKTVSDRDDWIEREVVRRKLKNVRRFPWVETKEVAKFFYASDLLIIPPTAKPLTKYKRTVLPIKTFLYLSSGVPILAPELPDTSGVLNYKNSALVEPDNLLLAQKTIRRIFEDKTWAKGIAEQAKLDSQNYTWERRAKKIIDFLNKRLRELNN
ncbi:MAG: glycosyltransferase [Caldithrix sp.]|nr:MAG: glycosyltransferase [Caldithrix sp.]